MSTGGSHAGWYPDPFDSRIVRWWDGRIWTDSVAPAPGYVPPADPLASSRSSTRGSGGADRSSTRGSGGADRSRARGSGGIDRSGGADRARDDGYRGTTSGGRPQTSVEVALRAQGAEDSMARWARICVMALPVLDAVGMLAYWADVKEFRAVWHWFRQMVDNVGTPGYVAPPVPTVHEGGWVRAASAVSDVVGLAAVILAVLFLVWQYRAAVVGRGLGYPAKRSPGWGVAFWFIPIVSLWMPYQAIRDCLPPDHPVRARVWRPWVLWVILQPFALGAYIALVVDWPVGLVLMVVLDAGYLVFGLLAYRVVMAIGADHRHAVVGR